MQPAVRPSVTKAREPVAKNRKRMGQMPIITKPIGANKELDPGFPGANGSDHPTAMHSVPDELPGGSSPAQYSLPIGATELQDLIEHRGMNFAIGNIFKASFRLGHCDHSDPARDLRKIIWFAERELQRITKQPEEEV